MKVTIDIPGELYRQVKAKSALEGRPAREVVIELLSRYAGWAETEIHPSETAEPRQVDGLPVPEWFGRFRTAASKAKRHDLDAIRTSIARGLRKGG